MTSDQLESAFETSSHHRSRWSGRVAYILAAVGCAAGLGNFWRFPILAYEHGGAAFIVAVILANLFIAYPLLLMESCIGQHFQASAPLSFNRIRKGGSWIQWMAIFSVMGILAYYVPVLGWAIKYLFFSMHGGFLENPTTFFAEDILQLTDGIDERGTFQWALFISVLGGLLVTAYALRKGVKSLSPIIKVTATLPFVFLVIIIVRGVTLPGAEAGLVQFLVPKWHLLLDIKLWQAAISQAFFSVGVALGYFIVAASHREQNAEIPASSLWILVGNFSVSFLSGLAVFSVLGFMAHAKGVPLESAATGGPMLVFSVFPTAISMMPSAKVFFAVLLFLTMISLAIDSIFGLMEATAGAWNELRQKSNSFQTVVILTVLTAITTVPFLFGSGLYRLDITDHFIVSYVPLMVGAFSVIFVLKHIGAERLRTLINQTSGNVRIPRVFNIALYVIPVFLICLTLANLVNEFRQAYGGYPFNQILLYGVMPVVFIVVGALVASRLTLHRSA